MSAVTCVHPGIAGQPLDICAVIGPGGLDICPITGVGAAFLDSILPGLGGVFKLQMTVLRPGGGQPGYSGLSQHHLVAAWLP